MFLGAERRIPPDDPRATRFGFNDLVDGECQSRPPDPFAIPEESSPPNLDICVEASPRVPGEEMIRALNPPTLLQTSDPESPFAGFNHESGYGMVTDTIEISGDRLTIIESLSQGRTRSIQLSITPAVTEYRGAESRYPRNGWRGAVAHDFHVNRLVLINPDQQADMNAWMQRNHTPGNPVLVEIERAQTDIEITRAASNMPPIQRTTGEAPKNFVFFDQEQGIYIRAHVNEGLFSSWQNLAIVYSDPEQGAQRFYQDYTAGNLTFEPIEISFNPETGRSVSYPVDTIMVSQEYGQRFTSFVDTLRPDRNPPLRRGPRLANPRETVVGYYLDYDFNGVIFDNGAVYLDREIHNFESHTGFQVEPARVDPLSYQESLRPDAPLDVFDELDLILDLEENPINTRNNLDTMAFLDSMGYILEDPTGKYFETNPESVIAVVRTEDGYGIARFSHGADGLEAQVRVCDNLEFSAPESYEDFTVRFSEENIIYLRRPEGNNLQYVRNIERAIVELRNRNFRVTGSEANIPPNRAFVLLVDETGNPVGEPRPLMSVLKAQFNGEPVDLSRAIFLEARGEIPEAVSTVAPMSVSDPEIEPQGHETANTEPVEVPPVIGLPETLEERASLFSRYLEDVFASQDPELVREVCTQYEVTRGFALETIDGNQTGRAVLAVTTNSTTGEVLEVSEVREMLPGRTEGRNTFFFEVPEQADPLYQAYTDYLGARSSAEAHSRGGAVIADDVLDGRGPRSSRGPEGSDPYCRSLRGPGRHVELGTQIPEYSTDSPARPSSPPIPEFPRPVPTAETPAPSLTFTPTDHVSLTPEEAAALMPRREMRIFAPTRAMEPIPFEVMGTGAVGFPFMTYFATEGLETGLERELTVGEETAVTTAPLGMLWASHFIMGLSSRQTIALAATGATGSLASGFIMFAPVMAGTEIIMPELEEMGVDIDSNLTHLSIGLAGAGLFTLGFYTPIAGGFSAATIAVAPEIALGTYAYLGAETAVLVVGAGVVLGLVLSAIGGLLIGHLVIDPLVGESLYEEFEEENNLDPNDRTLSGFLSEVPFWGYQAPYAEHRGAPRPGDTDILSGEEMTRELESQDARRARRNTDGVDELHRIGHRRIGEY